MNSDEERLDLSKVWKIQDGRLCGGEVHLATHEKYRSVKNVYRTLCGRLIVGAGSWYMLDGDARQVDCKTCLARWEGHKVKKPKYVIYVSEILDLSSRRLTDYENDREVILRHILELKRRYEANNYEVVIEDPDGFCNRVIL